MAEAAQKYQPMHPLMRSMQKRNAKKMLAQRPPVADPVADAVAEVKKNLETVLITKEMTPQQRQAIAAGAARAWYADTAFWCKGKFIPAEYIGRSHRDHAGYLGISCRKV